MQPNRNDRFRPASSPQSIYINPRFLPEDTLRPALVLGGLCLLVPPVGLVMLWRSRHMTLPIRAALSALAFLSMTLIFWLLMRPAELPSDIRPMPATPVIAGYGSASQSVSAGTENAPAQPDAAAPAPVSGDITDPFSEPVTPPAVVSPDTLTAESIVYAVTNNASSFHLYQICSFQENNRALTLQQATNEGLSPCEICIGTGE